MTVLFPATTAGRSVVCVGMAASAAPAAPRAGLPGAIPSDELFWLSMDDRR